MPTNMQLLFSFENATHQHVTIVGAGFTSYFGKKLSISLNPPPSVAHSWENGIKNPLPTGRGFFSYLKLDDSAKYINRTY